jgi:ParB/RepB/Spo0J family partition protein
VPAPEHVSTEKELAELKVARKQGDTKTEILALDVDGIVVPEDRLRRFLDANAVNRIAESMADVGQQQPIIVRMVETDHGMSYHLISGRHRLEATRKLGRPTILAVVISNDLLTSDEATLIEIDENLARGELTPAERAAHVGKRKQIYEKLHPETVSVRKRGGPGRGKKNESTDATRFPAFIDDAAAKTGKDRATVAKYAAIAEAVPEVAFLAGTSLDSQGELSVLAELRAEERASLIEKAKAGEKVSARKTASKNKANSQPKLHKTLQAILDLSHVPSEKLQDLVQAAANATEERERLATAFRVVEDLMRRSQDTLTNTAAGDHSTAHRIPTDGAVGP